MVYSFHFLKFKINSNFFVIFSLTHRLFRNILFNFPIFYRIPNSPYVFDFQFNSIIIGGYSLYHFNSFKFIKTIINYNLGYLLNLLINLLIYCFMTIWSLWRMFHVCLKIMYIVLLVGKVFCRCLLGQFG